MDTLEQSLSAMERACESEQDLLAYVPMQIEQLVTAVKLLPEPERAPVIERLERIATLIEGKMMLYGEELQALGGQIRKLAAGNAATNSYRTVAVLPIRPASNPS